MAIEKKAAEAHATATWQTYRTVSYVAIVGCIAFGYKCFALLEHPAQVPYVPWDHMHIRRKPFPFKDGTESLFHDDHFNALPDGYKEGCYHADGGH